MAQFTCPDCGANIEETNSADNYEYVDGKLFESREKAAEDPLYEFPPGPQVGTIDISYATILCEECMESFYPLKRRTKR